LDVYNYLIEITRITCSYLSSNNLYQWLKHILSAAFFGQESVRPFIHPSIHPSIHLSIHPSMQ